MVCSLSCPDVQFSVILNREKQKILIFEKLQQVMFDILLDKLWGSCCICKCIQEYLNVHKICTCAYNLSTLSLMSKKCTYLSSRERMTAPLHQVHLRYACHPWDMQMCDVIFSSGFSLPRGEALRLALCTPGCVLLCFSGVQQLIATTSNNTKHSSMQNVKVLLN